MAWVFLLCPCWQMFFMLPTLPTLPIVAMLLTVVLCRCSCQQPGLVGNSHQSSLSSCPQSLAFPCLPRTFLLLLVLSSSYFKFLPSQIWFSFKHIAFEYIYMYIVQ